MNTLLLASELLQWLAILAGAVVLLGLARQVGVLHERSAPLGALVTDKGPDVGEPAPLFSVRDFRGRPVQIGGERPAGELQLLLFLSPTCPMCEKLLPTVRSFAAGEGVFPVIVSDGDEADHRRFLETHELGDIPYVVSPSIGMRFQIGKVPYAVLLDHTGRVRAKGLVNTREHLESLVEAHRTGFATLQEFVAAQRRPNGAAAPTPPPSSG
ncbi:MAG: methylamine dehydrogenase accessory protein MauD [Geminicoccaceae bacterium]|nr:methylamine dehydrogenase accessory protein MauD [Geminicoccaceae bacterium]MCS7266423.1 methylamine dehydrogenase accessory protein MauD [Geminicoccaceae bacterium]MCX7630447.1 methylamine dehydrogenase accessory protein MauD [Geminicoccaceae bacterium]MDW8124549.1 methylamine dehydrogenase accessory protein MauD [Geminicoccaceae bacterium]MDW8341096.1 methylamine dehydrogenase accessory protein MauD [Geminicoccaceae bacterium]